ncbi:MAG: tryptophan synthase subunit alpha [Spirochaetes bacterium]|nr:tryptophan synthase subunit alpha [Spirochaetota bacterium]
MGTINQLFKNKKISNFYVTAGYPDIRTFKDILITLSDSGADVIEIGIPFSDPIADGDIIQNATIKVLENHINIEKITVVLKSLKGKINSKLIFMSYYNPVYVYGLKKFIALAKSCFVSGVIIPDLPFDEGKVFYDLCIKAGLDTILLTTSVTDPERLKKLSRHTTGFLYFVSVLGTTGVRNSIPLGIISKLKEIRRMLDLPLCLGFGIKSKESIKPFYRYIDGVIIGSALIALINKNMKNKKVMMSKIRQFVQEINKALQ